MDNNKKLTDKEQQELNNFKKWLEAKKYSPKNKDEVKKYYAEYQKEKAKASEAQTKKAAHGTKLTYFKSLKNQCAEDEEVVYFKKGGSVKCGCKKKEDGGEIPAAKEGSAVAKFKKMRAGDKVVNGSTKQPTIDGTKKANEDPNKDMTWDPKLRKMRKMTSEEIARAKKNLADARQGKGEGTPQRKKGGEINKDCGGSAIKKFKMHRQGGSLNGIPFMQQGTPKGGIYKPDWYKSISAETKGKDSYGHPDEELVKRSQNGDIFRRRVMTTHGYSPDSGPFFADTLYQYIPKGQKMIEATQYLHPTRYKKLKEAFQKIVSIPTKKAAWELQDEYYEK